MYNQVSRCFKTTGGDHSVCTILSAESKLLKVVVEVASGGGDPGVKLSDLSIVFSSI